MIHARGLARDFRVKGQKKPVQAVRGIDLDVASGELVAFLGPNGAGKSTTLRMLTTLITPTAGTARVAGCDVTTDATGVRRRIGYIGQGNGAAHAQRVGDELVLQGRAYGMAKAEARERASELLATLSLAELERRTVDQLSGGQRRRLDIAIGLMHRPPLLFLDEPSTGLDPQNRANLAEHVRALHADHGATVFLTTHYLEEADLLAERVIIIDHGAIIADGTPERLKADLAGDLVTLTTEHESQAESAAQTARRLTDAHELDRTGTTLRLRTAEGSAFLPEFLRALESEGVKARTAEVRRPTLDDVFLHLTGRSLREEGEAA
jgi:ABC-2 type transport system ATP-binding protein